VVDLRHILLIYLIGCAAQAVRAANFLHGIRGDCELLIRDRK
jgi:hypothetical protein